IEACGIDMPELIRLPKCWTSLHPMGTASEIRRRGPWSLVQQCRPRCLDGCHVVPTSTARTTDMTANDHRVVAGPAALIPLRREPNRKTGACDEADIRTGRTSSRSIQR